MMQKVTTIIELQQSVTQICLLPRLSVKMLLHNQPQQQSNNSIDVTICSWYVFKLSSPHVLSIMFRSWLRLRTGPKHHQPIQNVFLTEKNFILSVQTQYNWK